MIRFEEWIGALTRRQREVVDLVVTGLTNAEIAEELVVTEETVKFHVSTALRRLHVLSRVEMTAVYWQMQIADLREAAVCPCLA